MNSRFKRLSTGARGSFVFLTRVKAFFVFGIAVGIAPTLFAQSVSEQITQHLNSGEFPAAIQLAEQLQGNQADDALAKIAASQYASGATKAAFDSVSGIQSDLNRSKALTTFANHMSGYGQTGQQPPLGGGFGNSGNSQPRNQPGGQAGGITEADFDPLMELIKSVISPDSWSDTNGDGTIQAYPSGVYVDANGLLRRIKTDSKSAWEEIRKDSLFDSGNRKSNFTSQLRKVSLTRLEREAQLAAAQGHALSEDMKNLAGIYEIKYLMVYPETGDIVIAGPAGAWSEDAEGRAINNKSGKPVLQLDDLVVCLRNAWGNNGKFGCAITPREKNLAETKKTLAESKLKGKAWRDLLKSKLGRQDVSVFGIDPQTHTGRVLVEADYRMKLIGMGLEKSIPEIPSYLQRIELQANGQLPPMDVVRWWFTLNYDDVTKDEAGMTFTFTGPGVKVLSENEMINDFGQRIHTGQSKGPTREFAEDFTEHFEEIADVYPIYNQLKNVFDLAMVSSLIRHQGLADQTDWHLTYFGKPKEGHISHDLSLEPAATEVDSVMNHRVITQRRASSTVKHTVVGISGGIRFDVHEAISADLIKTDVDGRLSDELEKATPNRAIGNWWWD